MTNQLLQTKFIKPARRSYLVPRRRPIERLNDGLAGKLTLVSTPAGFGKTTLVADWLQQIKEQDDGAKRKDSENDLRFSAAAWLFGMAAGEALQTGELGMLAGWLDVLPDGIARVRRTSSSQ